MKPNYELKSQLIKDGKLLKLNREVRKSEYFHYIKHKYELETGEVFEIPKFVLNFSQAQRFKNLEELEEPEEWFECERINNAFSNRRKRLSKRINDMLDMGQCLFLTLTFTNDVFKHTTPETRRKYVSRYLKEYTNKYVANIDFGEKNGREHYHAVVLCDKIDISWWQSNCGNIDFEKIIINENTCTKLSKYVAKLANHAIKETTKRNALLYSR